MKEIKGQIDCLETMLSIDEKQKTNRFFPREIEAIKQLIQVVKTLDTLLWAMDRPARPEND